MAHNLSIVTYAKNKWQTLNNDVVTSQGSVVWTIYDAALKALAYVLLTLPLIGTPLALTFLAASVVIDAAIYQQWNKYKEALHAFFEGKLLPQMEGVASKIDPRRVIANIFNALHFMG